MFTSGVANKLLFAVLIYLASSTLYPQPLQQVLAQTASEKGVVNSEKEIAENDNLKLECVTPRSDMYDVFNWSLKTLGEPQLRPVGQDVKVVYDAGKWIQDSTSGQYKFRCGSGHCTSTLNLDFLRHDQSGLYRCDIRNQFTFKESRTTRVTVLKKPQRVYIQQGDRTYGHDTVMVVSGGPVKCVATNSYPTSMVKFLGFNWTDQSTAVSEGGLTFTNTTTTTLNVPLSKNMTVLRCRVKIKHEKYRRRTIRVSLSHGAPTPVIPSLPSSRTLPQNYLIVILTLGICSLAISSITLCCCQKYSARPTPEKSPLPTVSERVSKTELKTGNGTIYARYDRTYPRPPPPVIQDLQRPGPCGRPAARGTTSTTATTTETTTTSSSSDSTDEKLRSLRLNDTSSSTCSTCDEKQSTATALSLLKSRLRPPPPKPPPPKPPPKPP